MRGAWGKAPNSINLGGGVHFPNTEKRRLGRGSGDRKREEGVWLIPKDGEV